MRLPGPHVLVYAFNRVTVAVTPAFSGQFIDVFDGKIAVFPRFKDLFCKSESKRDLDQINHDSPQTMPKHGSLFLRRRSFLHQSPQEQLFKKTTDKFISGFGKSSLLHRKITDRVSKKRVAQDMGCFKGSVDIRLVINVYRHRFVVRNFNAPSAS
jgi:hypothetical protein